MGLTKLVFSNARDFGIGLAIGAVADAYWGADSIGTNLLETAFFGGLIGLLNNYNHKIFGGEPLSKTQVVKRTLAMSTGLFAGQSLVTAYDYYCKMG